MSAEKSAESGESMKRAPGGGVELEVVLRLAPTLSPT